MSFIKSAIGAIAGSAGSLLGDVGSAYASARQAQKQMDFQERMSNTAYQRAAKDLEAAGLNRILALGSPASTPAGAMGQVPSFGSAMASGAGAATGVLSSAQQIQQSKAQTDKIIQESSNLSQMEKKLIFQGQLYDAINPHLGDIIKAGWEPLMEKLKDPVFMKNLGKYVSKMATGELNAWTKLLSEQMGQAESMIDNFLDRAERAFQETKDRYNRGLGRETSGRIHLGDTPKGIF